MSSESPWASLPLLPLRCILDHLPTKEALQATTVCQHWRMAILLYEGHRDTLKLHANRLDEASFLTRIFRKHVKSLHLYLDGTDVQMDRLFTHILPQFFDAVNLKEVLFIGPYLQLNHTPRYAKLRRIISESLIFKHIHSLETIGFVGADMDDVKNEYDRFINEQVEYHSRPLSFNVQSNADTVLMRSNATRVMYSNVQHIIISFSQLSCETLETLSHLRRFNRLTVIVCGKDKMKHVDWSRIQPVFPNGLNVALHLISLNCKKLEDVMQHILVEDLPLTCLKVMFCRTLHIPLISQVVRLYKSTLREFVWSDAPFESAESHHRNVRPYFNEATIAEYGDTQSINPFMLLCWQCEQLRRLVIHGYWIWQYDIVGYVRLRKSLEQLEVSAVYGRQGRFHTAADNVARVLEGDCMRRIDPNALQMINQYSSFRWTPRPWNELPLGLRRRPEPHQRGDYIIEEITRCPA